MSACCLIIRLARAEIPKSNLFEAGKRIYRTVSALVQRLRAERTLVFSSIWTVFVTLILVACETGQAGTVALITDELFITLTRINPGAKASHVGLHPAAIRPRFGLRRF